MNLVEQAEKDLSFTLEDKDSGFAVDVILIDPNDVEYPVTGQTTDISFFIDPGSGVGLRGRYGEITLRLSTLNSAGAEIPQKSTKWRMKTTDVNNVDHQFSVEIADVDRKLGIVRIKVELFKDG